MSQTISNELLSSLEAAFGTEAETQVSNNKTDKVQAQVYLNPGITIAGADGDDVFATLPFGIPIDTQNPKPMTTSAKLNKSISAGNKLLEILQEKAKDLKPGEAIKVNIPMELRRRKSTDVGTDDTEVDNLIDIKTLFG